MNIEEKPWGAEHIWASNDKYAGKILHIVGGQKLSLQYHTEKDETVMLFMGAGKIQIGQKVTSMPPYKPIHIPPFTIHRLIAVTDCSILEVSTKESGYTIRVEDDYGRALSWALCPAHHTVINALLPGNLVKYSCGCDHPAGNM